MYRHQVGDSVEFYDAIVTESISLLHNSCYGSYECIFSCIWYLIYSL